MPSKEAALRFLGSHLSRKLQEISYDPAAVTSWEEGDLSGKLRPIQRKMRDAMRDSRSLKYIFNCSRRLGKTFLLLTDALEIGLREVNARLPFAAPTQKQMKNIILPIFREIAMDCPPALRPVWKASDQTFYFPRTGSELPVAGCENGHEEKLRGTGARKAYVDEAQSIKRLEYVVQDILMPQLLTTNGTMVIAGTPPKTPVHDFVKMMAIARAQGNYLELPIWEAGYPPDIVARFMEEAGGANSTTWRREYLCQVVVDETFAIVPEWKSEFERVPPRDDFFQFYHKLDAMDIGVRDKTMVLFGWYDFKRATLFVDDEVEMSGPQMTTELLARAVKAKEVDIFGAFPLKSRIADNDNLILLQDLGAMHGLHFVPTGKDTLEAMVNHVRVWTAAGRIVVNPRCKQLVGCLRYGVWDDQRKEFERYDEYGHFDALAALIYMVRNVNEHANPIPHDFQLDYRHMHIPPAEPTQGEKMLKQLFRPRFRR